MIFLKKTFFILLIFLFPAFYKLSAQNSVQEKSDVSYVVRFLKKYFQDNSSWHITTGEQGKTVFDLIHFIEGDPVDTVISRINTFVAEPNPQFVIRYPENVYDSLRIPGFIPVEKVRLRIGQIDETLNREMNENPIPVPIELLSGIEKRVRLIPPEEGMSLFTDSVYQLPDSLKFLDAIPDKMVQTDRDFKRILHLDSLRDDYVEKMRIHFNDSVQSAYRDSIIVDYQFRKFSEKSGQLKKRYTDSVRVNNYRMVAAHNESVVKSVNDSIAAALNYLARYANQIDTTKLSVRNLDNRGADIFLKNESQHFTRFWLKNQQNDSLSVIVRNIDKNSVMMLIDDGVTFSRFTEKTKKDFDFEKLAMSKGKLQKVDPKYKVFTPWRIGGDGTVGFTQTYLENWKKGGKSAISLLFILKGFANYSSTNNLFKWENYGEVRNGWIKPGGEKVQKNDDKLGLGSRLGLSAFKKWYYSTGLDFETQFFNGYKYPDMTKPISGYMSPGKLFFKIGLDYKPNKNLSLFISPITSKTVFVRDTVHIDQTKLGVERGKKSFWEPGLNTDLYFKKDFTKDIMYETKYKMFINYRQPFTKYDIDWENLLVMRFNDYINMRMMVHFIYDDNVMFKEIKTVNGKDTEIWKPKMQIQELITIGFSYKINRQVSRAQRTGPGK